MTSSRSAIERYCANLDDFHCAYAVYRVATRDGAAFTVEADHLAEAAYVIERKTGKAVSSVAFFRYVTDEEERTYRNRERIFEEVPAVTSAKQRHDLSRNAALEQAAVLVQDYDTCGDHTQCWQDNFAREIRKLKS